MDENKIQSLDAAIVAASKKIKVLNALVWPADAEEKFLRGWRTGNPELPSIQLEKPDVRKNISELEALVGKCNGEERVERFLMDTAESYANAGRMLLNIGKREFTKYSSKIYGRPDAIYRLQGLSAVDGAKYFLEHTEALLGHPDLPPTETDIAAKDFASWLKTEVDEFFQYDTVEVVVDPNMSSKAL